MCDFRGLLINGNKNSYNNVSGMFKHFDFPLGAVCSALYKNGQQVIFISENRITLYEHTYDLTSMRSAYYGVFDCGTYRLHNIRIYTKNGDEYTRTHDHGLHVYAYNTDYNAVWLGMGTLRYST